MKTILSKTLTAVFFTAIFGVGASAENLRVGTNATYAPWEYMNTAGEFEGFDMDIARALAQKAGYDGIEIIDVEFDALIANLGSDRFDIVLASMDITEDRLKSIDFVGPYADSPKRAASKAGEFKDIETIEELAEALDGKTVGVQAGTTMALWLEDDFDADIEVRTYRTFDEISADLLSGRIDAGLAEASNWDDLIAKNGKDLEQFGPVLNAGISQTFGNGVGIGLKKDNPELKERIEKALDELRIDGTLKTLAEKYFGVDISL